MSVEIKNIKTGKEKKKRGLPYNWCTTWSSTTKTANQS